MGMMYAHHIVMAADYLLRALEVEGRVPYSRFYDGTEATQRHLAEALGMSLADAEWYGAEGIMDEAAFGLAEQGYVRISWLDEELADGEPAYEIELLEAGRGMLAAGKRPVFRDLYL